jgi:hypothetical protein
MGWLPQWRLNPVAKKASVKRPVVDTAAMVRG